MSSVKLILTRLICLAFIVALNWDKAKAQVDPQSVDPFENCQDCLTLPCYLQIDSSCTLQTRYNSTNKKVSFQLNIKPPNNQTWMAIGFNSERQMVNTLVALKLRLNELLLIWLLLATLTIKQQNKC
jgi:hypothetical protein